MTLRVFLWWLKRAADPVGAHDAEEAARLRADIERLKAGIRELQKRHERRERIHTSDFTQIMLPLNDVDPASTGPTHSRSTGKPIG